jgi:hypothetical protein
MPDVDDRAELLCHCLVVRGIESLIVGPGFSARIDPTGSLSPSHHVNNRHFWVE